MNLVDLLTVSSFGTVILLGVMYLTLQDMRNKQPEARIHARMLDAFSLRSQREQAQKKKAVEVDVDLFTVTTQGNAFKQWISPKLTRLRTVAGASGIRIVIGAAVFGEIAALLMSRYLPLPSFLVPLLIGGLPIALAMRAYSFLVDRFRQRFLDGFPDLIDLLVRAVRAGVPVTQVIGSAADEVADPLRREFRLMGDSLQIGLDLEEVLAVAVRRIEVADFSFFCVCLLLQRETGGQLGETLENLAGIVRTRREIRQKSKALTGEARITTKILSAIPPIILGSMFLLNRTYVDILLGTPAGQKLLTFSAMSVVIGVIVITKMSKLDTSR